VVQTRDYLRWLDAHLRAAVRRGRDIPEVLAAPVPPEFSRLAVFEFEFARSVAQLYPRFEMELLRGP
jgi:hypothetical protein